MSKHTQGPWHFRKDTIREGRYFIRVQSYGYAPLATVLGDKRSTLKQSEANARLIAAAPNLLDVLLRAKSAIEALDGTTVENEKLLDDYRRAIAMATGEPT